MTCQANRCPSLSPLGGTLISKLHLTDAGTDRNQEKNCSRLKIGSWSGPQAIFAISDDQSETIRTGEVTSGHNFLEKKASCQTIGTPSLEI